MFTCIGTVNHDNIYPCIKYHHVKLNKLVSVYVIFKIMKFLSQNFMLTNARDRLRYNILLSFAQNNEGKSSKMSFVKSQHIL